MRHRCPLCSSSVTLVTSSAMVAGTRACQSKAIFDGHKRVEAWFEPSRALRCGHAHLPHANPECGRKLISRLNLPGSRRACEPLGGLGPAGGALIHFFDGSPNCAADYPTSEQLLFCSTILGRRIEWDGYPDS